MELTEAVGKTEKRAYSHEENDEELRKLVWDKCYAPAYTVASAQNPNKHERIEAFEAVLTQFLESLPEEERDAKAALAGKYYHDVEKEAMRRSILDEGKRLDGRKTNEIRPIWSEVDFVPGPHGSALFTRGETQSLTTVTLGTKLDEKIIDNVMEHGTERFLLHYNFPPFSTGEARPQRGTAVVRSATATWHTAPSKDDPSGLSLCCSRGFRYPGVERFLFYGHRLRGYPRHDGCRCHTEETGERHCHGSHLREQGAELRHSPISWATKITWATWTSRCAVPETYHRHTDGHQG